MLNFANRAETEQFFETLDKSFRGGLAERGESSPLNRSIDDYLEELSPNDPRREYERQFGTYDYRSHLYRHLRDLGAVTVSEGLALLGERRVSATQVEEWIPHGIFNEPLEYDAVKVGYPELAEKVYQARVKNFEQVFSAPVKQYARTLGDTAEEVLGVNVGDLREEEISLGEAIRKL